MIGELHNSFFDLSKAFDLYLSEDFYVFKGRVNGILRNANVLSLKSKNL